MITWIQKTFHEHFRFVFIALLVVSLVAFIFVNNTSVGFGLFQSQTEKRPFFGINLAESGAIERIQKDAITSVFFQFGSIPPKNDHLQNLSYKRHALVYTAGKMGLPHPSPEELENHIRALRYFRDAQGKFDTSKYLYFQVAPKAGTGLDITFNDFLRVMGDDLRVDHLQKLISGPGYLLPAEVQQTLKQNESTWTLVSAEVDFKNTLAEINVDENQIKRHFEENRSKYVMAPQVRVDYIEFLSSQFQSSVKVTDEEVRAYYDANPTRFPKSLAVTNAPRSHNQDYELVRANAEVLLRQQRAQALATTAASDLALALGKAQILPGTPEFNEYMDKNHVSIRPLSPFPKDMPPAQFGSNGAAIAKESFTLTEESRYSNPVRIGQGAVILVWQGSIPEQPAGFSEVSEKVKNDYINEKHTKQNQATEKRIRRQTESDLKAGLTFQIAITKAAASEGAAITTKNHAPVTLRQRDARQSGPNALEIDRNLMETLGKLDQGQISSMIIDGNIGKLIYVQGVKYPDLTETNPEYVRIENNMALRRANATFDTYVANLVDSELRKSNNKNNESN